MALGLALALLAGPATGQTALEEVSLGVAAFERVGASGQEIPDVSSRLAERLATQGLGRVVGPAELALTARAEPSPEALAQVAREAGVSRVLVGRITRLGNRLSVDARLLEAPSGAGIGSPLVEEVARPDDLGRAIESLTGQVLARLTGDSEGRRLASGPADAGAAPGGPERTDAAGSGEAADAEGDAASSGVGFDSGAPIAIKADELEVVTEGKRRKFVFRGHVKATQDDLEVNSSRLEAFYPPGGSQPDRLVATGSVRLAQEGRVVTCEKATFFRDDQRVECEGQAQLDQDCDRVRGDKIVFFLDKEVMRVTGAADVQLRPDAPGCESQAVAADGAAGGSSP